MPEAPFLTKWFGKRRVVFDVSGYDRDDIFLLKELLEADEYRPVVDRTYPLSDAAAAHRDIESRTTAGSMLLLP